MVGIGAVKGKLGERVRAALKSSKPYLRGGAPAIRFWRRYSRALRGGKEGMLAAVSRQKMKVSHLDKFHIFYPQDARLARATVDCALWSRIFLFSRLVIWSMLLAGARLACLRDAHVRCTAET